MATNSDKAVAHIVFFTLRDPSQASIDRLVDDCHKYLDGHDGVLAFYAGERGEEFARPVNDAEFHVALHVVFENKAVHDRYQTDPRHVEFIERNKATWAAVRVFDSYV